MANKKINQTFVMSFEGRKYVPAVVQNCKVRMIHKHIDPKFVSDKEAIEMLNLGALTDKDFKVLPDGYKVKGKTSQEELQLIEDARAIEAAGAFCIVIDKVVHWMPKSICRIYEKNNKIYAPEWLLNKKGLI